MADIELVIKIPEEEYDLIVNDEACGLNVLTRAIANGTPLPKGHGRLVDVDDWLKYCTDPYEINYWNEEVPAIVEADKESEE